MIRSAIASTPGFALAAAATLAGCGAPGPPDDSNGADLVLRGGTVWTGDPARPTARAIAIGGGVVLALADDESGLDSLIGPGTRVLELAGRAVVPGFVDAHTHFISGGFQLSSVDLRDADSPEEFTRRIATFAATLDPGDWILGGDWDHERWGGELPRRSWIDSVAPDNPIFVNRLDGHMALASSAALEAAGVIAETQDPPGGAIVRDEATGQPTGVLKDEAMGLVARVIPPPPEEALDRALDAAAHHALSLGVTQVHDMGTWEHLATYRRAHARGALPLRVYSVVPLSTWDRLAALVESGGRGDERLWWGGLKAFVDGSLGSTTAWFYEPYTDEPTTSGLITTDTARLRSWITDADRAGLHVLVHAIGDRANDWLLDVYRDVTEAHGPRDRRFRIEHAQHLAPSAFARFAEHDVIASMQPYHAADDGRWADRRIGPDRTRTTYAFRSLLDAGAALAFGSDWTVALLDPMLGLDAALTRRTLDGAHPEGWVPAERISLDEALAAYTRGSAFAGFSDPFSGTLAPGMRADLVILDGDPFVVTPERVGSIDVAATLVDGEVVFDARGLR
jgi:predicted amidohydrolase YtcJ